MSVLIEPSTCDVTRDGGWCRLESNWRDGSSFSSKYRNVQSVQSDPDHPVEILCTYPITRWDSNMLTFIVDVFSATYDEDNPDMSLDVTQNEGVTDEEIPIAENECKKNGVLTEVMDN